MKLKLDDHFNQELPADPELTNGRRQVSGAAFSFVSPRVPSAPKLLHASNEVAQLIGLSAQDLTSNDFLEIFSGARVPDGARPYAMCYGGHQFGNWAGQLGDGRAINLCEVLHQNKRWTLQLKGAGETPYSRTADGLAVLRSSLREHLCSEAMYHLGVPTTRSLSLIATGDDVMRDMMYDGNAAYEPGAVVCRVAPSFIRFGNFQIFAANGDVENLRRLADYTIKHHFPAVIDGHESDSLFSNGANQYINFFRQVTDRTLDMVIHWQRVGFVHGVMNTDNMSIHGDTIDFGPYGWLEGYDHDWTPNTTDRQHRRYRYGHQPQVALWNLLQLANALYPLVEDAEPLQEILHGFQSQFEIKYKSMMGKKIGLSNVTSADYELLANLEETLQLTETDMTIFFRLLANVDTSPVAEGEDDALASAIEIVADAFYKPAELTGDVMAGWRNWFRKYRIRLNQTEHSDANRAAKMNRVNPKYVLRNYMAQLAIDAATEGDVTLIDELYQLLKQPYDEQPDSEKRFSEKWFAKRPEWARNKVGCSMLSCSS